MSKNPTEVKVQNYYQQNVLKVLKVKVLLLQKNGPCD